MSSVNLFYLSDNTRGGWVSYTVHLMKALEAVGMEPMLYKVRERGEGKTRPFGFGAEYRNVALEEAECLVSEAPSIVVARGKRTMEISQELIKGGAFLVCHDSHEVRKCGTQPARTVVIRKVLLGHLRGAHFIRHPYSPTMDAWQIPFAKREGHACCISRIDFDKHISIILDANRLLPEERKVLFHSGDDNRIYTKFQIMPKYPEWVQRKQTMPREAGHAVSILRNNCFMVDMGANKQDGGGTQYTFLEAWDAGCVPIINEAWVRDLPPDDMTPGFNCLVAGDGAQLADVLKDDGMALATLVRNSRESLRLHAPIVVGQQYKDLIS